MLFRKKYRAGQSGMELLTYAVFMLFVLAIVYVSFLRNDIAVVERERYLKTKDLGEQIAFEINSAVQVGHGYERNVTLPNTLLGKAYNATLDGSFVLVNTSGSSLLIPTVVDTITGSFKTGKNTIKNRDGTIYVNT